MPVGELTILCALLVTSGFFSSSETALFSLSGLHLDRIREKSPARYAQVKDLLSRPRSLIVTLLIGNELANVSASTISAVIIAQLYGTENIYFNLVFVLPLLLVFGEILPKTFAISNNMAFAKFEAPLIKAFYTIILPVRKIVRWVSEAVISLIAGKINSPENIVTEDMLKALSKVAVNEGTMDYEEAEFIEQIFEFGDKTVEEELIPRSAMFSLPHDISLEDAMGQITMNKHTKIPVYVGDKDQVRGILHVRDIIGKDIKKLERQDLLTLCREPYFVPETKKITSLFRNFRDNKITVAMALDEYGGITGIITMEDVLECIFGDIYSSSESVSKAFIRKVSPSVYRISGDTLIKDFNEYFGTDIDDELAETISGRLVHEKGELPAKRSFIEFMNFRFQIISVKQNRIHELELRLSKSEDKQVSGKIGGGGGA